MAFMAAGLLASQFLVKYNRKGFMLDKELRQEREFQEQDMRIQQFMLYREDVRDLVNLTTAKMDLYLVIAALFADKLFLMVCKQNEALPPSSPEWAVELNALSLGSGVLFLMLSMWLAIYASVSAHAFGTRLLTQFVRLPIATEENLRNATAESKDFEEASVADVLRLPWMMSRRPPAGEEASSSSSTAQPADGQIDHAKQSKEEDLLPTAMLEHIRLYRKVQLNWQAYDAYARVSLFLGANCILYSCLYWSLGKLLENQNALIPEMGAALMFSTLQLALSRLDLRLRKREAALISTIVFLMPICTTAGMLLYKVGVRDQDAPDSNLMILMELCAFSAHTLHALVGALVLSSAWPDTAHSDEVEYTVYLPGKFRSVLYLDVFGWLTNVLGRQSSGGGSPDAGTAVGAATSPETSFNSSQSSSAPVGNQVNNRVAALAPVPEGGSGTDAGSSLRSSAQRVAQAATAEQAPAAPARARSVSPPAGATAVHGQPEQIAGDDSPGGLHASSPSFAEDALPPLSFGLRDDVEATARELFAPPQPKQAQSTSADSAGSTKSALASSSSSLRSPPSSHQARRTANTAQVEAFGGNEAMQRESIEEATAPTRLAASTFTAMPVTPTAAQAVNTRLPGQRPWRALRNSLCVVVILWSCSALWAFTRIYPLCHQSWSVPLHPINRTGVSPVTDKARQQRELVGELCDARSGPGEVTSARRLELQGGQASHRFVDMGCGLQPSRHVDVATMCDRYGTALAGDNSSSACTIALLRPGGRAVSLCRLVVVPGSRDSGDRPVMWLRPQRTIRLPSGAVALRQLALVAPMDIGGQAFRVVAKTQDGAILMLRERWLAMPRRTKRRAVLAPQYEVTQARPDIADVSAEDFQKLAALAASPRALFSISVDVETPQEECSVQLASGQSTRSCAAAGSARSRKSPRSATHSATMGLRIDRWSLHDGSHSKAFLPGVVGFLPELLGSVCGQEGVVTASAETLPSLGLLIST